MSDDNLPAYIGRDKDGAIILVCADEPEYAKDTAKSIAKVIRGGGTVERSTVAGVRAAMDTEGWGKKKPKQPVQPSLFEDTDHD